MATVDQVSQAALRRACSRIPGLAPQSAEVVELARGEAYVVVRLRPSGFVVLDSAGRIVRGRERLACIARHRLDVRLVAQVFADAKLEQRLEHADRSIALLEQASVDGALERSTRLLAAALRALAIQLGCLLDDAERRAGRAPTRRTLGRSVALLNAAAASDRAVVRCTRELSAALSAVDGSGSRRGDVETLRRWVVGRLASTDLPFYLTEIEHGDGESAVHAFVEGARS